jgi:hypothetical protein
MRVICRYVDYKGYEPIYQATQIKLFIRSISESGTVYTSVFWTTDIIDQRKFKSAVCR